MGYETPNQIALFQHNIVIICKKYGAMGGGAVGRTVISDTRDPWFKSSHWEIIITTN